MPWQPAPVVFPDIVTVLTSEYRTRLPAHGQSGVTVAGTKPPKPRKERMVVFNRDGGPTDGLRDKPRVRCRVWAPHDDQANNLAGVVAAIAQELPLAGVVLLARKLSGPIDVPDDNDQPQRYLLFEFHTRGTPLT